MTSAGTGRKRLSPIRSRNLFGWGVLILVLSSPGWATFSIVAVDTLTGEVGSAGASCLDDRAVAGGVLIISDVIPGRGAIHTQASHNATNKQNAHNRMVAGDSPQQIITWLTQNDVQNNPGIRQYGVVDLFQGSARSAAYTGTNCQAFRGHLTGATFAIQGNILLNRGILDSMQSRFLNTPGTLADKLMSALQGANVPGADTRCLSEGVSSQSAFVRVARSGDSPNSLYLDLRITRRPTGVEPIDTLQTLYDRWKTALFLGGDARSLNSRLRVIRKTGGWVLRSADFAGLQRISVNLRGMDGRRIFSSLLAVQGADVFVPIPNHSVPGVHFLQLKAETQEISRTLCLF